MNLGSKLHCLSDGTKVWYLDGNAHRDDGPAIIKPDGTKTWCRRGHIHRDDGPAIEYADGSKEWWLEGKPVKLERADFNKITLHQSSALAQIGRGHPSKTVSPPELQPCANKPPPHFVL
jgi:hypothetical protein